METKLEMAGDDLVVTIPQDILDRASIKIGDDVDVEVQDGRGVITKAGGG